MLRKTTFVLLLLIVNGLSINATNGSVLGNIHTGPKMQLNHSLWDSLLQKHVDKSGNVNYKSFKKDQAILVQYLGYLRNNKPTEGANRQEQLAYYINLYNAVTVSLILDNYPLKSIKDIKNPWGLKIVAIGHQEISLGDLEHKILRKMNDPRIHFAINCASYSCPKLLNQAFTSSNLEALLEQTAVDFINDKQRNTLDNNEASLSAVFKWFKKDFTKEGSLVEYINKYARIKLDSNTRIKYSTYNWALNEAK
ncbi:DUF547 domain-containing protein [Arenibacter certesii]|uniref:DUF547 domain-containing protein n=1 Tax=Arenibacter certesii TaxID=228955 RepID=A0A918IWR0_9FLAO|nr:DUF547 domain-containing protein [Arenibacter certesii]GGW34136.1 DUF547 domain-containing protein [Arenibacter certesii]